MFEIRRLIFNPKRLVILLLLAVVNLALFSGYCRTTKDAVVSNWEQMHAWGVDVNRQEQEALKRYIENDYPEYLTYIRSQSQSQSVLGKLTAQSKQNIFIDRNLQKTVRDYKKLGDVTLSYGENRGVQAVMGYGITDYLMLIAPLLLVLELLAESDTAVGDLTRTTRRGRLPLTALRVISICTYSAMTAALLYCENILYTVFFYGNPGLTRALQSIPAFQFCPWKMTIGSYWLSVLLLKILALTVISVFVWIVLSRMHPALGWTVCGGTLGGLWLLSRLVLPTSRLNHLRFLNIFTTLEGDTFFVQYCNLNWFNHPSGFMTDMLVLTLTLLAVLLLLALWRIGLSYPKKLGTKMEAWTNKVARKMSAHLPCYGLFGFEGWKLLIAQKALPVLILAGLLGFSMYRDIHLYLPYDWQKQQLYIQYEGEVTKEKITNAADHLYTVGRKVQKTRRQLALANEVGSKEAAHLQYVLAEQENEMQNYEWLLNSMLSLLNYQKETGRDAWLVQEDHYMAVFREYAAEQRSCMVLLIFVIFAFSGMGAYDNQYETGMLLRSTKRGRLHMRSSQVGWMVILTAIAAIILHGVVLLHVYKDIGLPLLEAPAQSYTAFRWIPFPMTLRGSIVWLMVFRIAVASVLAGLVFLVSRFSRTPSKALLLSAVLFLLPSALAESGITQFDFLDFVHFLTCVKKI